MPCYAASDERERDRRLNELTRMLCVFCIGLERRNQIHLLSPDLAVWWRNHKEEDEKRKTDEQKFRELVED